ncbi:MAG: primosomal protein N' [Gemmatimonadota bacterium]|nr:primosomal protein N' [Gemmatimonadota bacterium]
MSEIKHRVEVALPLPIHRTFTYEIEGEPPPSGTRVLVPFRNADRIGWVVGTGEDGPIRGLRSVLSVLDDRPTVTEDILELCRWMAEYYAAPLGITIRATLPAVLSDVSRDYVTWTGSQASAEGLRPRERKLMAHLSRDGKPHRVTTLRRALGMGSIWAEVRALEARGLLRHEAVPPTEPAVRTRRVVRVKDTVGTLEERERLFGRADRQREAYDLLEASGGSVELRHLTGVEGFSRSVVQGLQDKGLVELEDEEEIRDPFAQAPVPAPVDLVPTPAQRTALERLTAALDDPAPAPFLLQGITGSGKTLVYIELLREVLRRGKTAIVLVPEISLTPQTVSRFQAHFGGQIAVLHSGLSSGERYDAWRLLRDGERRVAVGARSALFAPLEGLGLVVVDEEHDGSYKQSEAPRYQARDLAVMRARSHGAVCLLGSATPSLESRYNAETGKFVRLELPERAGGASLPDVDVVDLREERKRRAKPRGGGEGGPEQHVFSTRLVEAVELRLRKGEQVILLLNRRGYSSFVQCRSCGEVERCENCSISLTFHRVTRRIVCHHCRFEAPAPSRCPRCGSDDLSFRGVGTEQVERVAVETFPSARIARMDVDTTSGKWAHQRILDRVERHEVDILLGTQMIAKGLDFPGVTLVGVVNADVGLHLPDFRASERTFQLLSQVAGRAGRGALGGEVLVQTSMPEHYAVQAALSHDYEGFVRRELEERRHPRYPPHVRLANVVVSSPDQTLAAEGAEAAASWLKPRLARGGGGADEVELVGPAPAPIERLHGRWRWHFLLRAASPKGLGVAVRTLVTRFRLPSGDVRLALDRDPVALL